MTVLYSSNFEAETTNVTPTGWTALGDLRTFAWTTIGVAAIGGLNGVFAEANGGGGVYTGIAASANQAVRLAFRVPSLTSAGHRSWVAVLRSTTNMSQCYRIVLESNNTGLRLSVSEYNSGNTFIASSDSYNFAPAPEDLVHLEVIAVGTTISGRAWIEGAGRPATISGSGTSTASYATVQATSSAFASGYAGGQLTGPGGTWFGADHVVITDGAGGEDFFYGPPPDAVATISWAEGSDINAAAVSVTIDGVAIAAAWTEGADVIAMTGTAAGAAIGTITTPPMRKNNGYLLANETGVIANVYNATTGALVVRKTGLTSDSLGVVTISDALIVAGTSYSYEIVLAANGRRLPVALAA